MSDRKSWIVVATLEGLHRDLELLKSKVVTEFDEIRLFNHRPVSLITLQVEVACGDIFCVNMLELACGRPQIKLNVSGREQRII